MIPPAPALGPSTMCSLTITASKPASSAITAMSTRARRSRGGVSVQFSLRTRTSFGRSRRRAVGDLQRFQVGVEVQREVAALAPDPGDADPAEGRRQVAHEERVDPDHAGADRAADALGPFGGARVDDPGEPVGRRVRERDALVLVGEGLERENGPKTSRWTISLSFDRGTTSVGS